MNKVNLTIIILTYNEERHIRRCLESILLLAKDIFIVDSFSNDDTLKICETLGVHVLQNPFINQAKQFNWALENCPIKSDWVMRLDADEYLTPELVAELSKKLPTIPEGVSGAYIKRRVHFKGKWIKHGGYYPTWLLRLWRNGQAVCEERWMDEHIKLLKGESIYLENDFVDDNLHNLTVWTTKHNNYATRETIELLNLKYQFAFNLQVDGRFGGTQEQKKRWLKQRYASLPLFVRPFVYFFYRYFFKLGFMDGKEGLVWHVLQGFWYRFLVDAKVMEIEIVMKEQDCDARTAIKLVHIIEM